jgi:hypothetical protein
VRAEQSDLLGQGVELGLDPVLRAYDLADPLDEPGRQGCGDDAKQDGGYLAWSPGKPEPNWLVG